MQNTLLVIIIMLFTFQQPNTKTFEAVTVLELFTSQGCSSCPRADALLGDVKNNKNVIVLSYHVDYWNYIGWTDPFSNAYNTKKQRDYGQKFLSNRIYTPQLVINGKTHFVGSNAEKLKNKLKHYSKELASNKVVLSNLKRTDDTVNFDYTIEGDIKNKNIRFALVIEERTTEVKRGENRNRTIKNENIVVAEEIIKIYETKGTFIISIPELIDIEDNLRLVAITQTERLNITGGVQKNIINR